MTQKYWANFSPVVVSGVSQPRKFLNQLRMFLGFEKSYAANVSKCIVEYFVRLFRYEIQMLSPEQLLRFYLYLNSCSG
ncbi:hypothetical protein D3C86_2012580 [compost metagenome]